MKVRKVFFLLAAMFMMVAIAWFVATTFIACYNMPYNVVIVKYIPWHAWVSFGIGAFLNILVRLGLRAEGR